MLFVQITLSGPVAYQQSVAHRIALSSFVRTRLNLREATMCETVNAGQISIRARVVLSIRVVGTVPGSNEGRDLGERIPQVQNSCSQKVGMQIVKGNRGQRCFCVSECMFAVNLLVIKIDSLPMLPVYFVMVIQLGDQLICSDANSINGELPLMDIGLPFSYGQPRSSDILPSKYFHGTQNGSNRAYGLHPIRGNRRIYARPRSCLIAVVAGCAEKKYKGRPSKPSQPSQHKFPCQKEILS